MNGRVSSPTVSAITILLALAAGSPALARVGVTSTTAGDPIGKPVDQAQRVLRVGVDVFANERVTTGANDRAQLLFLDGSALSIGPNAEMTLDRYVYDPAKGTGTIAISAGKGILRLVGGAITKETEATIRTPSGTIGIRGGITIVEVVDETQTNAYFVFGRGLRGTTDGRSVTATRAGSAIVLRAGRPPSSPSLANQQTLAALLGLLEAPSGRTTPGAPPVEQRMAQSQVTPRNSGNPNAAPPAQPGPAATNGGLTTNQPPNAAAQVPVYAAAMPHPNVPAGVPLPLMGRLIRDVPFTSFDPVTRNATRDPVNNSEVTSALLSGTTLTATTQGGSTFTLPYITGGSYAVSGAPSSFGPLNGGAFQGSGDIYLFDLVDSGAHRVMLVGVQPGTVGDFLTTGFGAHVMLTLGDTMPFLPAGSLSMFNSAEASSLFSAYAPVLSPTLPTDQRSVFLQSTLYINGSGSAQSSYFGGVTGVYMQDTSKPNSIYASGGYSGTSRELSFHVLTSYVSAVGTMETSTGNVVGQGSGFMAFVPDAITTDNTGTTTRTTQAAASILQSPLTTTPYYFLTGAAGTGQPADLGVTRTSRILNGYAAAILDYHGSSTTDDYQRLNMQPSAVTLQTDAATNRAAMTMTLQDPGDPATTLTLNVGSLSGNGPDSAFIDDRRIGLRQSSVTGSFYITGAGSGPVTTEIIAVTQAVTPTTQIDGVTPCVCEFMTWGYWSADIKYTSGPRAGQTDRAHIGTWLVGELPSPAQLPTSGTAIYNGHAIGNVVNGSDRYVAAGTFQQTWDFTNRTGAVSINNFDGVNYAGTSAGSPSNVNFAGPITGTAGRAGNVSGSFFKSPTDAAAYQAGTFSITGTAYKATGTFAGQR